MLGEYDAGYENFIDSMVRQMESMQYRIDCLHADNAHLRELVRFIMHQCNDGNPRCDECIDWNDGECVALLHMRELGGGGELVKEYRLCSREHGSEHTTFLTLRDWGGRQNWQGNATDEEREEAVMAKMDEHKKYQRVFYGISERDMWVEVREVGPWEELPHGGTVSESYIRPAEEGSVCPIPRASVIFEGRKFTFDAEDSERFAKLLERHLRKLAGLEVD